MSASLLFLHVLSKLSIAIQVLQRSLIPNLRNKRGVSSWQNPTRLLHVLMLLGPNVVGRTVFDPTYSIQMDIRWTEFQWSDP